MKTSNETIRLMLDGMTCINCQTKIEKEYYLCKHELFEKIWAIAKEYGLEADGTNRSAAERIGEDCKTGGKRTDYIEIQRIWLYLCYSGSGRVSYRKYE